MNKFVTRKGEEYIIRPATPGDAKNLIAYSKLLFESTDQLLTTAEEYSITIEDEEKWINNLNAGSGSLLLVAERNSQPIGMLFFSSNSKKKNAHTGELGVNVHPAFQGLGIGRKLVETLLEWANKNTYIEKVYLTVFASNTKAINLYSSLGFKEEGRFIKAIKQPSGEYVDVLQMYILTSNREINA